MMKMSNMNTAPCMGNRVFCKVPLTVGLISKASKEQKKKIQGTGSQLSRWFQQQFAELGVAMECAV